MLAQNNYGIPKWSNYQWKPNLGLKGMDTRKGKDIPPPQN